MDPEKRARTAEEIRAAEAEVWEQFGERMERRIREQTPWLVVGYVTTFVVFALAMFLVALRIIGLV